MKFKNSSSLQIFIYLILTSSGFMNQCVRCTKEVKDIALIEASVAAIQKTQQDIQRQVQPETYCIHHYWWHNNYMSLCYSISYINHTDPFISETWVHWDVRSHGTRRRRRASPWAAATVSSSACCCSSSYSSTTSSLEMLSPSNHRLAINTAKLSPSHSPLNAPSRCCYRP